VSSRAVILEGKGEFDVAELPSKPFRVQAKRSGVGVVVLGTRFRFEDSDEYLEIIENLEGSVRAYSLADTNTHVIMHPGDRYGFDGVRFIDLNDIQEEYVGEDYDLLYVLDRLMELSEWKVTSGPEMPFEPNEMVNINLDQDYEDILADLRERADFDYIPKGCDGCYEIIRFITLE